MLKKTCSTLKKMKNIRHKKNKLKVVRHVFKKFLSGVGILNV